MAFKNIQKEKLGDRVVVQIYKGDDTDGSIGHIYFEKINNDLYDFAKEIQKFSGHSLWIALPNIKYDPRVCAADDNYEYCFGDDLTGINSLLRVIVKVDGVSIKTYNDKNLVSIATLSADNSVDRPIFEHGNIYPQAVKAKLSIPDILKYTRYFFYDIVIAHSMPISNVVDAYISNYGYVNIFKKKVEFALRNGCEKSIFGDLDAGDVYVNFASMCVDTRGEFDYVKYLTMWDSFVRECLFEFLPDINGVYEYLNGFRRDQVNKEKLHNRLIARGTGCDVVLLPNKKPKNDGHYKELLGKYGICHNCEKNFFSEISIMRWERFISYEHELIADGYLQPYKVIWRSE